MTTALRFVHLLAVAIWIGSVVFFSFVTAPALFAALPREMAGRATPVLLNGAVLLLGLGVLGLLAARPPVEWGH